MIFASSKVSDGNMSLENRKRFLKKLGINFKNIAEVKQTHSNKIILVGNYPNPIMEADGLITNRKDTCLLMKTADCMAIGFLDFKHNAIGLIHAGWRGLENEIIKQALEKMKQSFDTNPKDLTVKISPSIGPCCYRMNIWQEAENQLTKSGILLENIENPKICTYESREYFSHRRSDDQNSKEDFRFVTIIGL